MKQFLFLLFTVFSIQSYCQTSLDSTTTWTYSFDNFGFIEPRLLFISGDTIIDNIKWFKLDGDRSCAFQDSDSLSYIREDDRRWMVYDVNRKTESMLYDFNLTEGESYVVNTFGPDFPIDVRIDSVRIIQLNGKDYQVQYCSNPMAAYNGFLFASEVIEGIGSREYLFPQGNICDPQTGPIRCFNNISDFVDFDPERDCDATYLSTSTDYLANEEDVKFYPNPARANEDIVYTSMSKILKIEVFNQSGMRVYSQNTHSTETAFKLLDSGIYYVRLRSVSGAAIKKLIVTN